MRAKPLSTQSLLELIDLFEQSGPSIIDGAGQRLFGVPGWALTGSTALSASDLSAWSECVGYAGSYPAPCGDDLVMVELQECEEPELYMYRCPETFSRKTIGASDIAVLDVNAEKLLSFLANLLRWSRSFGQSPGRNKLRPVPGCWF